MEILKKEFLEWYDQLEKQMQCHFCREVFSGLVIYSCEFGHNICSLCKVEYCLACKSPQPFIQNHFAQILVTQLTVLKLKATQMQCTDIKPVKPKTANISCQKSPEMVNKMCLVTDADLKELSDKKLLSDETQTSDNPITPTGFYPCLNKFCKFVGTYSNIVQHFESNHSSQYEQVSFQKLPFSKSWELAYSGNNSQIIRVIDTKKLGLFVLHFFINGDGEMKGHVLLYNIRKYSQKYEYNLEIQCDGKKISQTLVVDTCRIPEHVLYDPKSGLFISKNVLLYNILRSKLTFKCTIEIVEVSKPVEEAASSQKQSGNNNPENRQRRENRKVPDYKKNENQQRKFNKNQPKLISRNPNISKSIPSLLGAKISTPNAPNTSSTSIKPQFSVNQMSGPLLPNPTLYPDLKHSVRPPMPSNSQQCLPGTNSLYGNMPPSFFSSQPPPLVNYEYQRNPPIYGQTHHINLQSTEVTQPSAPVVDHERQAKIRVGVEAVQKAHLKKLGINSVEDADEVNDNYRTNSRKKNFIRYRNGSDSEKNSNDKCVIS